MARQESRVGLLRKQTRASDSRPETLTLFTDLNSSSHNLTQVRRA
jgi:hypothetical protein